MIMPALKSLDDVFEALNKCRKEARSLGDIERHAFQKRFEEMRRIQPEIAFIGLGMLATFDKNETAMRKYFTAALKYHQNPTLVYFNYAVSLTDFGCIEEAALYFEKILQDEVTAAPFLDRMASAALTMSDESLALKILDVANKLNISGLHINMIRADIAIANADSPEEEIECLEKFFPDEFLKENSLRITDEQWEEMSEFAQDIKQYI